MNRVVRILFLTTIWVVLWSSLSLANVLTGIAVSTLLVTCLDPWKPDRVIVRPLRALHFGAFFLVKLVESSLVVAKTVMAPRDRLQLGIIAVPLDHCSDAVATVIADAISLTPGTLTLDLRRDPHVLYVHALDTRDITRLRKDIRRLETLAVRAFGDEDALAALARRELSDGRSR